MRGKWVARSSVVRALTLLLTCASSFFATNLTLASSVASAHQNVQDYYQLYWFADAQFRIGAQAAPLNTIAFASRLQDGAAEWNSLEGIFEVTYNPSQNDPARSPASSCGASWTQVWVYSNQDLNGNLGLTLVCESASQPFIQKAQIRFNPNRNWYLGTAPVGASQRDFWSVATHEFGHVAGFGKNSTYEHFEGEDNGCWTTIPQRYDSQSMCPGPYLDGWDYQRDLRPHDKHTFNNWY